MSVIVEALERELKLYRAKLRNYQVKLSEYERKYKMSSSEFLKLFEEGKLGDEEDYFLWWSYLKAIEKVKEKIREIENEVQKLQRIR